jgi:hypothetical protein
MRRARLALLRFIERQKRDPDAISQGLGGSLSAHFGDLGQHAIRINHQLILLFCDRSHVIEPAPKPQSPLFPFGFEGRRGCPVGAALRFNPRDHNLVGAHGRRSASEHDQRKKDRQQFQFAWLTRWSRTI